MSRLSLAPRSTLSNCCALATVSLLSAVLRMRIISYRAFDVSLPPVQLRAGEVVAAFQCTVKGGWILNATTPYLWNTNVENGEADISTLSASILLFDGAFSRGDLSYFTNFLTVARPTRPHEYGRPFDLTVGLSIATNPDIKTFRTVTFSLKQLRLKEHR